jgi:geranylgeranyl reductase
VDGCKTLDVGQTLNDKEYIGMCRREVMDDFLRKRAASVGTNTINGLFMKLEDPGVGNGPITISYNDYAAGAYTRPFLRST